MHSLPAYVTVALAGFTLAFLLSRAPELRAFRLAQLIFVPIAFVAAWSLLPEPSGHAELRDLGSFVGFLAILFFIFVLLGPNIAYASGMAFSNFIDPHDWTPAHEKIALQPIIRLIDKDRYQDAFDELEARLKKHQPTYEALQLRAKLLHHFQRFDETAAALIQMLPLSHTTEQQLTVLELLAALDGRQKSSPAFPNPVLRKIRIAHELVLFEPGTHDRTVHKEIPEGEYEVHETLVGPHLWLVLKNEHWGNAETYWQAMQQTAPADTPPQKGFFYQIARVHRAVAHAIKGKPHLQKKNDSRALLKEANQKVREDNWPAALPLLQKASAEDPDSYEIAYRLVQAAHHSATPTHAANIHRQVLTQSHWTEDEQRMLKQLR